MYFFIALTPLARFRVGTAILLILALSSLGNDFNTLYAPSGALNPSLLALGNKPALPAIGQLFVYLHQCSAWSYESLILLIQGIYYFLCLALLFGAFTKPATLLLLALHNSIFISTVSLAYGADYFCQIALFYCLLFPVQRYQSLDARWFHYSPISEHRLHRCFTILRIHLALVYFFGGLGKALGPTWWNGQALWKALHLPFFYQPAHWIAGHGLWPVSIMPILGILVWGVELCYPLLLVAPRKYHTAVWAIILLHVGIGLFMGLLLFSLTMIFLNVAAWFWAPVPIIHHTRNHSK